MQAELTRGVISLTLAVVVAAATASASVAADKPGVVDVKATLGYQSEVGIGTGILLTAAGEILTNNHIIRGATSVTVTDVDNGQIYPVTVVGYDVAHDVAVLKIKGTHPPLKTIALGSSRGVKVGHTVTAFGNAGGEGLDLTRATGNVLGLGKSITAKNADGSREPLSNMIVTDALTLAGESGGPLLNASGRVIGINTAAYDAYVLPSGKKGSVAFAIPITQALSIARGIANGHETATNHIGPTPLLGIDVLTATGANVGRGVPVNIVFPGSPAAKTGILAGDRILTLAGKKVTSPATLSNALIHNVPKDRVPVVWLDRAGKKRQGHVVLGVGPSQ
jgi:S1-C subfamily serine protease